MHAEFGGRLPGKGRVVRHEHGTSPGSPHPTGTPGWEHIAGNQACLAHILRDYQDAAEAYPDADWPAQAQRALRGLIHAWHVAREQGLDAIPADTRRAAEHEFRHARAVGLSAVPRVPGPKNSTTSTPAATCWNSAATAEATCSCSPTTPGSGRRTIWLHTAPLVVAGEYGGWRGVQVVVVLVVSVSLGGLTFSLGVRGRPDLRWGLRRPER